MSGVTTSAPRRAMWLIVRAIAFSLPGIDAGREDDGVVGPELDEAMVVDGDAGQCGLRFALRAGRDAQHVLRRVVLNVRVADLHAGRDAEVAKPLRDLRVLHDAPADERHLALELSRQIDEHLHAIDARRERRRRRACPSSR